jgi:biopolymer transport protein ExbD
MAAKTSDDEGGPIADINVTPFVDIVLVLLIIFMVAVPMIMNQAIKVNLPKAASGKAADSTTVAITIKRSGKVYLNGKEIERPALQRFLAAEARANKQIRAIVSADQEVAHGTVVSYLDLLNLTGISRYAISVEKPPEPDGTSQ